MKFKIPSIVALMAISVLQGCAYTPKPPVYAANVSEAKNITLAGGLNFGIQDRPASESKKPYRPGTSFGDLIAIANVGAGAFEGGVLGLDNIGSAAFNAAHGVWATSGDDNWSTNYFYSYIPKDFNPSLTTAMDVRSYVENTLIKNSISTLSGQGFKTKKLESSQTVNEKPVNRWALENNSYGCSFEKVNCVLTIYTVHENQVVSGVNPSFLGDKRAVDSWRFFRGPNEARSSIDITSYGISSALPELAFYKELSASMPNWFNLYIAPNKASTPKHESGVVPYNFVLNDGRFLEFIIPNS